MSKYVDENIRPEVLARQVKRERKLSLFVRSFREFPVEGKPGHVLPLGSNLRVSKREAIHFLEDVERSNTRRAQAGRSTVLVPVTKFQRCEHTGVRCWFIG